MSTGRDAVEKISSRKIDCSRTNIKGIHDAVCPYLDGKVGAFQLSNGAPSPA